MNLFYINHTVLSFFRQYTMKIDAVMNIAFKTKVISETVVSR